MGDDGTISSLPISPRLQESATKGRELLWVRTSAAEGPYMVYTFIPAWELTRRYEQIHRHLVLVHVREVLVLCPIMASPL